MKAALLLLVLAPVPAFAQGLGDAAARERQKREEKKAPPAKVFTDQDLPGHAKGSGSPGEDGSAEASPPGDNPSAPGAKVAAGSKTAEPTDPVEKERQQRKLLEAEWRVRFANAREELANAEANSWREVVRTDFYQGIPVQMRVKEQVETEELKRARKALADLEEEFRRTGLPPGWAREK
ncbi:MAG TPA: hypothetical protein VMT70_04930 [Vicinamibacteria bacterium]|nr:hypothetical protein [Vicinamibacteria bacterium]